MRYLVQLNYKQAPTPEIMALVPAEQAHGQQLDAQGVRESLFVAQDMSTAWQVFKCDSREELDRVLAGFPLTPYVQYTVTPLADPLA